ncbi:MAG TPA: hypothetical protein VFV34_04490 [Blastocatellia bacterium]|nr:hypothetical protein [Blastocatellia bacterium]
MADEVIPSRTKARLAVLGVFVLGLAAGALAMNLYNKRSDAAGRPPHGPRPPLIEMMKTKLQLTPQQAQQVEAILDETFQEYNKCKDEVRPRFDAARQKSRERIRAVLTSEQLPKYEEMIKEADARRDRFEKQGGPGWHGRGDGPRDRGENEKHDEGQEKTGEKKADEKSN